MYQNIGGKIQTPLKLVEQGYADMFPTRKYMKINNLPRFRPPERLQDNRNIGGKIQTRLKLVERGYADLFPTWKPVKINNLLPSDHWTNCLANGPSPF